MVGLTELPLRDDDGRYLLVDADPRQRTAVLSLPALGGLRMQARTRHAVRTLVGGMTDATSEASTASGSPASGDAGDCSRGWCWPTDHGFSSPGSSPRSSQRWPPEPSPRSTPRCGCWQAPCPGGASVATVASVALVVAWLVIDGELWDRPDDSSSEARERSRLYNTSTLVTLTTGVLICYAALYVVNLLWALFVLDPAVMGGYLQRVTRVRRPVRARLVRRVRGDGRRRTGQRAGVRRGDPRRRVLQARGGTPQPARARTELRARQPPPPRGRAPLLASRRTVIRHS